MREAIGGNYLFQIVILFILLFTGIMCLTINHSKAFAVKDEIINIIENKALSYGIGSDGSLNDKVIEEIVNYVNESGYRITGKCDEGYVGYTRDGRETSNNDANICIMPINVSNSITSDTQKKCGGSCEIVNDDLPNMYYYNIKLFYQIDAPIIGNALNLTLKASTKTIYNGE